MADQQVVEDLPVALELASSNSVTAQQVSLWMTPFVAVLFLVSFLSFPGFFPPMSPNLTAHQVAAFYAHHTTGIRFSMLVYNVCGILLVPFFSLIVVQMKRMATPSQVFAYSYLSAIVSGATMFAIADLFWLAAAYRVDRDPALIQLLNDLAWIIFTAPVGMLVAQNACLALAIYLDGHPRPIFPRWVAHFNIAVGVIMTPAALAAVVRTGPFAWNGFVSFWLKISAFSVYVIVMFLVLRIAINRQAAEEQPA